MSTHQKTASGFSRRSFMSGVLGSVAFVQYPGSLPSSEPPLKSPSPPNRKAYPGVVKHTMILWDPYAYSIAASILKCKDGELLIAFWQGMRRKERVVHPDPSKRGFIIRSNDGGQTWSQQPEVIGDYQYYGMDSPGITQLSDGKILVNAFIRSFAPAAAAERRTDIAYRRVEPFQWAVGHGNKTTYVFHSLDKARTWLEPVQVDVSPFRSGCQCRPIVELPDGALLMPCYDEILLEGSYREDRKQWTAFLQRSNDKGRTWGEPTVIAAHGVHGFGYNEPALIYLPSGKTVALLRTGPPGLLYQSDSYDGGRTWSTPAETPIWGFPAHLWRLQDGRLLATYGHRRAPFGIRACVSPDEGKTWDVKNEIILRDDFKNTDLGYPTTAQLDDGTLLTAYWGRDINNEVSCIQGTFWKLLA